MNRDYTRRCEIETPAEREARLDSVWQRNLPCFTCRLKELCKYANHFKRPDYNADIIQVHITCKLREPIENPARTFSDGLNCGFESLQDEEF